MSKDLQPITIDLNLRKLNFAYVTRMQGKTSVKAGVFIPFEDNFITDTAKAFTDGNGETTVVRNVKLQLKLWPVTDEAREKYDKKNDYDVRVNISKEAREALGQNDPEMLARLDRQSATFDSELRKRALPYVGKAYVDNYNVVDEEMPTNELMPNGEDDLPF